MTTETMELETTDDRFDSDLADELAEASYYANEDTVLVKLHAVSWKRSKVEVTFDPPAGEKFKMWFDRTKDPSDSKNGFNELLDYCGHGFANATELIDERIPFKYREGEWELSLPRSLRERLKSGFKERVALVDDEELMKNLALLCGGTSYGVVFPFLFVWILTGSSWEDRRFIGATFAVLGLMLWGCLISLMLTLTRPMWMGLI